MSDDRLQMPEQVEKAFEYLKQAATPTDFELSKQRALTWEQVEKRGRRWGLLSRWWKPTVGLLASAVVVLLAVLVPHHLSSDKAIEVQPGNLSASGPIPYSKLVEQQKLAKSQMYEQQGKHYVVTEVTSDVDLVWESPANKNQNILYAVKNGVSHEVCEFPKSKIIEGAQIPGNYLIGFHLYAKDNNPQKIDDGELYVFNPIVMKVKRLSWGAIDSVLVWRPTPYKFVLVAQNVRTADGSLSVIGWDWDTEEFKTFYHSNEAVATSIFSLQNDLMLFDPNKLVRITENGNQVVDQASTSEGLNIMYYGSDASATDLIYTDGAVSSSSYGSYHGNVQVKRYNSETHKAQTMLGGIKGDQYVIAATPSGDLLMGNFVADHPSMAYKQKRTEVSGDVQLWYLKPGVEPAKLVYTKKLPGEEIYRAFPSIASNIPAYTATDLLLVPDDNTISTKALRYQWDAQHVLEVDAEKAKQASK
jgi:hypothetical protein